MSVEKLLVLLGIREPDEQDVFCGNCGARNPQGTVYCMGCGKSLS